MKLRLSNNSVSQLVATRDAGEVLHVKDLELAPTAEDVLPELVGGSYRLNHGSGRPAGQQGSKDSTYRPNPMTTTQLTKEHRMIFLNLAHCVWRSRRRVPVSSHPQQIRSAVTYRGMESTQTTCGRSCGWGRHEYPGSAYCNRRWLLTD